MILRDTQALPGLRVVEIQAVKATCVGVVTETDMHRIGACFYSGFTRAQISDGANESQQSSKDFNLWLVQGA